MLKLDSFRLLVDQKLSELIDHIFRQFTETVVEHEREVYRLKQEIDRRGKLLETAGRAEDNAAAVFTTEEQQQNLGWSFSFPVKQEEDGALGPEGTDAIVTQNPDWLKERPDIDQRLPSNQIQSCMEETGPQPVCLQEEVVTVKQEVDEEHMVLEAIVMNSQQEDVLQSFTTEEGPQVRGRDISLHVKEEEVRASGPEDTMTQSIDDERRSSNRIQSLRVEDRALSQSDSLRPECEGTCVRSDPNRYSCSEDSDGAQLEADLQSTLGSKTPVDQKLLVCFGCQREFSSKRTLAKHIRQNMSQDQMSCSLRKQKIPFQIPVRSFSCRVCKMSFFTQGFLVRHAEFHCKEPENRCGACGECLDSTKTLREHLQSHKELGSTCDICGKRCSSIKTMEIHRRTHTGEKPYRCRLCNRDFSRKESLERHQKVHSADRPHSCSRCRRTFSRRDNLVQHLKSCHQVHLEGQSCPA